MRVPSFFACDFLIHTCHAMLSATLVFSLLVVAQAQSDPSLTNVTQAFSQAQIVPDVVPSFSPAAGMGITFIDPASMMALNVTPGVLLTMEQTSMPPQFSITSPAPDVVANITYVLALIDPDAPTPQNASEAQFRHFVGGDFAVDPTAADPTVLVNSSAALTEFFPPTPPAGSDPHRYILLMYVQPDGFDTMAPSFLNDSTPRNNFNLLPSLPHSASANRSAETSSSSGRTTAAAPTPPRPLPRRTRASHQTLASHRTRGCPLIQGRDSCPHPQTPCPRAPLSSPRP
ncbi:phosphatidylethanolamine-binding protein [Infundibulicybe gibba]|nr:phosphatidylethanolamine-binding protein [Infundibulicybe gibba]